MSNGFQSKAPCRNGKANSFTCTKQYAALLLLLLLFVEVGHIVMDYHKYGYECSLHAEPGIKTLCLPISECGRAAELAGGHLGIGYGVLGIGHSSVLSELKANGGAGQTRL